MAHFEITWTDTFGGDANYGWVVHDTAHADTLQKAITKFKKVRYGSGPGYRLPRHKTNNYGNEEIRIDIVGANVCAFINEIED